MTLPVLTQLFSPPVVQSLRKEEGGREGSRERERLRQSARDEEADDFDTKDLGLEGGPKKLQLRTGVTVAGNGTLIMEQAMRYPQVCYCSRIGLRDQTTTTLSYNNATCPRYRPTFVLCAVRSWPGVLCYLPMR